MSSWKGNKSPWFSTVTRFLNFIGQFFIWNSHPRHNFVLTKVLDLSFYICFMKKKMSSWKGDKSIWFSIGTRFLNFVGQFFFWNFHPSHNFILTKVLDLSFYIFVLWKKCLHEKEIIPIDYQPEQYFWFFLSEILYPRHIFWGLHLTAV